MYDMPLSKLTTQVKNIQGRVSIALHVHLVKLIIKKKMHFKSGWQNATIIGSLVGRVWAQCAYSCRVTSALRSTGLVDYFEIDHWFHWGVDPSCTGVSDHKTGACTQKIQRSIGIGSSMAYWNRLCRKGFWKKCGAGPNFERFTLPFEWVT